MATDSALYQVEIIIFSSISPQGMHAEQWPPIAPYTNPDSHYITLAPQIDPTTDASALTLMPTSAFKLNYLATKLKQSPNYQILLHEAWLEQVPDKQSATPILISNEDSAEPIKVNGMMTLYLNRYFNSFFNLTFDVPSTVTGLMDASSFANAQGMDLLFKLLQSRRMRSNELNYIDHPLFGILLEVFPVKAS